MLHKPPQLRLALILRLYEFGKTLHLAGQIALDPKTNQFMSNGSIEDQTRRVLDNLTAVLAADGLTMDQSCRRPSS